jgi:tetratricopeptide (TPR) repeat protein
MRHPSASSPFRPYLLLVTALCSLYLGACSKGKDKHASAAGDAEPSLAAIASEPMQIDDSTGPEEDGTYRIYVLQLKGMELLDLMDKGQYEKVSAFVQKLRDEDAATTGGFSAVSSLVSVMIGEERSGSLALRWLAHDPQSGLAHLLYGDWCISKAWQARGGGWADTVTDEGWEGFESYLEKARKHLTEAYRLDDQDYLSCDSMITVCMGQCTGQDEEFLWFNRATKLKPDFYGAYHSMAWALMPRWGGGPFQTIEFIQNNVNRGPQFPMLQFYYMDWVDEGELLDPDSEAFKASMDIVDKYMAAYPNSAAAYREKGLLYANTKQYREAMKWERKAIEMDPASFNRYIYAGMLYKLDIAQEGRDQMRAAIELTPESEKYWNELGRLCLYIRPYDFDTAIDCFTKAIELDPTWRGPLLHRARAYGYKEEYDKSLADFDEVIRRWPEYARTYYDRGRVLYVMGDQEAAIRSFDRAIELDPDLQEKVENFLK